MKFTSFTVLRSELELWYPFTFVDNCSNFALHSLLWWIKSAKIPQRKSIGSLFWYSCSFNHTKIYIQSYRSFRYFTQVWAFSIFWGMLLQLLYWMNSGSLYRTSSICVSKRFTLKNWRKRALTHSKRSKL